MISFIKVTRRGQVLTEPTTNIENILAAAIKRTSLLRYNELLFTTAGSNVPSVRQQTLNQNTAQQIALHLTQALVTLNNINTVKVTNVRTSGGIVDIDLELTTTDSLSINTTISI